MSAVLDRLDLDLPDRREGKVRQSWALGSGRRLIVTSDRLSAFDRIVGLVPHKGQVLNRLAAWWFDRLADLVDHHLLAVPDPNVSLVRELTPLPVEIVVRGRITGSTSTSLWTRYAAGERRCYGHVLPDGLARHDELPRPLITPTTKAAAGHHDEPIDVDQVVSRGLMSADLWEQATETALALFDRGVKLAGQAGLILADTKYEMGTDDEGRLVLIDEVHTPDSSRLWRAESLEARLSTGQEPESFDKEPVRLALRRAGFTGDGPVPDLGDEVWAETSARYVEALAELTGQEIVEPSGSIPARIRANLHREGVLP